MSAREDLATHPARPYIMDAIAQTSLPYVPDAEIADNLLTNLIEHGLTPRRLDAVYRTGRSIGRTIYVQLGDDPAKGDRVIGMLDTPELAAFAAAAMNAAEGSRDDLLGALRRLWWRHPAMFAALFVAVGAAIAALVDAVLAFAR